MASRKNPAPPTPALSAANSAAGGTHILRDDEAQGDEEAMRYFTRDLYLRLQLNGEADMNAADAEWDKAVERYDRRLKAIWSELPRALRVLFKKLYLHDAEVLSMGQHDQLFVIVVKLEVPPQELVTITYNLTDEPKINLNALPPEHCSNYVQWMHDEVDLVRRKNKKHFTHAILFSNGWEVCLSFRDVRVAVTKRLLPVAPGPASASSASRPADFLQPA
jgi:hypothetical protein